MYFFMHIYVPVNINTCTCRIYIVDVVDVDVDVKYSQKFLEYLRVYYASLIIIHHHHFKILQTKHFRGMMKFVKKMIPAYREINIWTRYLH